MSSRQNRKPGFRLELGYPDILLWREGVAEPLAIATIDTPGFDDEMRDFARIVDEAGGRLTAVLPVGEIWTARLALPGRTWLHRRRAARIAAAEALDFAPSEVAVVLGRRAETGSTPVAAVSNTTLSATRRMLATAGLKPAAIVGAGPFPGFGVRPAFRGGWQNLFSALPGGPRAALVGGGMVAAAAVLTFALPDAPGVAAPETFAPMPVVLTVAEAPVFGPPVATPSVAPVIVVPASLALLKSGPPKARPAVKAEPAALGIRGALPIATLATRNVEFIQVAPDRPPELRLSELTTGRLSDATRPPRPRPMPVVAPEMVASLGPALVLRPVHRPAAPMATAEPAPEAAATTLAKVAAAPAPVRGPAGDRPMPRPVEIEALVMAALTPAAVAMGSQTGGDIAAPPARPARVAMKPVAIPTPKPVAKAAAVPIATQQLVARVQAPAPQPVRTLGSVERPSTATAKVAVKPVATPTPQPVRVLSAVPRMPSATQQPTRVASVAPVITAAPAVPARTLVAVAPRPVVKAAPVQPVRVAAVPAKVVAPKPVVAAKAVPAPKVASAEPTKRSGVSRGNLSLIGVFGGDAGRHALVRLPNGTVQRVRAGDKVQGVQVASIDSDSVRLSGRGRDTLLQLPD